MSAPLQASPATKTPSVEPVPGATEDHSLSRGQLGVEVSFVSPSQQLRSLG